VSSNLPALKPPSLLEHFWVWSFRTYLFPGNRPADLGISHQKHSGLMSALACTFQRFCLVPSLDQMPFSRLDRLNPALASCWPAKGTRQNRPNLHAKADMKPRCFGQKLLRSAGCSFGCGLLGLTCLPEIMLKSRMRQFRMSGSVGTSGGAIPWGDPTINLPSTLTTQKPPRPGLGNRVGQLKLQRSLRYLIEGFGLNGG
jgi:hypothetical protein